MTSVVQLQGARPPGLPCEIRRLPQWEELRRGILRRAIRFGEHLQFDFRELLTDAAMARSAGVLMWHLIRPLQPRVLVGPGFGATPLLFGTAWAALEQDGLKLQVLMVRDKRKEHHHKRWVEGDRAAAQGARAVVIDDFMEGGSAWPLVRQALAEDDVALDIAAVAVFFDMWMPLGSRQLAAAGCPVHALFTRHDIGLSRDCFDAVPPLMKGIQPDLVGPQPLWWRFGLNDKAGYPLKCAPVIADDAVFVADDHSRMWCHDALGGDILWRADSLADPLKGIVQRLQHAEGSLVFGCYDGTVTRLDARSGRVLWRWRQDSSIHATPELDLAHRRLFVNTEQWNEGAPFGRLLALDFDTGRLRWSLDHAWWPPGSPAYAAGLDAVVALCNDQTLVCADADSGQPRWRRPTRGLVRGRPGLANDRVVVASESGWLECFDLGTGEPLWSTRYGRGARHQFTQVGDGCVFAFDGQWHFSAFDLETGALRWLTRLRSPGTWCPVALGPYWLAASCEGHLAVLDPRREVKLWEGTLGGTYRQPPAIGQVRGRTLLAAASNDQGLKVFEVHPHYTVPQDAVPQPLEATAA